MSCEPPHPTVKDLDRQSKSGYNIQSTRISVRHKRKGFKKTLFSRCVPSLLPFSIFQAHHFQKLVSIFRQDERAALRWSCVLDGSDIVWHH